jgi:hypothetical protein
LSEKARCNIDYAASGKRDNHPNGPSGVVFRLNRRRSPHQHAPVPSNYFSQLKSLQDFQTCFVSANAELWSPPRREPNEMFECLV